MNDTDDTQPGLTQGVDGTVNIGPRASKASQQRAEKEAFEHAQSVVEEINAETEKADKERDGS